MLTSPIDPIKAMEKKQKGADVGTQHKHTMVHLLVAHLLFWALPVFMLLA